MPKILITGGSGKLGSELKKIYSDILTPTRNEFDITKKDQVFDYIKNNKFDVIIHTAALTNVRLCEENKELAWLTNVDGTKNIVDALVKNGSIAKLVYVSTACVFSGDKGNYNENDIPHPKNFYGITKLVAESIARQYGPNLIVRTNFVAREPWPFPKAYIDRFGNYLFTDEVARGIKDVINDDMYETVHICGKEKMSMYDIAKIHR